MYALIIYVCTYKFVYVCGYVDTFMWVYVYVY